MAPRNEEEQVVVLKGSKDRGFSLDLAVVELRGSGCATLAAEKDIFINRDEM